MESVKQDRPSLRAANSGSPRVGGDGRGRRARIRATEHILGLEELGILIALIIVAGGIGIAQPTFLGKQSIINIAQQASFVAIICPGMVFLLSMREIDLSVGSIIALSAVFASDLIVHGMNPWLAALCCFGIGLACGLVNGLLANLFKIPTIIVTLGTLSAYAGLALVIAGQQPIDVTSNSSLFKTIGGEYLGVPFSVWAMAVVVILFHFIYRKSRFGYMVRAAGANPEGAHLIGISIERLRLISLLVTGGLAGFVGALTLAFFETGDPNFGAGYELLVIASCIIGGTALAGGSGTVIGALIGAILISVIQSGLIQFGLSPAWGTFVTGSVIILAVAVDVFVRGRRESALRRRTQESS